MDNLSYSQINALRQKQKELSRQRFLEDCRKRLDKIVSKKIETTFIGALDTFEKYFGFLWGYKKDERDLTQDEIRMDELWQQARTEILNKGNRNKRSVQDEILHHTVEWQRYKYNFPIIDK